MVKSRVPLDTLAQSGTNEENSDFPALVNKTEIQDKSTLKKRARSKAFSTAVAVGLVEAAEKSDGKKIQPYWNSYHCASVATVHEDGKVTSKYCKNRWCVTCNRIRTAKVIKQYLPDVKEMMKEDSVYFVTLTAPNVPADELQNELHRMKDTFSKIAGAAKKQAQRGKRDKFIALRKLECTYSLKRNDFNPHIHALVKGKDNSDYLLNQWLKRNPTADRKAQDITKVTGAGGMMEVFKYSAKMITKVENKRKVYTDAMHKIYCAFDGINTLQRYGFYCSNSSAVVSAEEKTKAAAVSEYEWNQEQSDWINEQLQVDESTGELLGVINEPLSGYKPGETFKKFLKDGFVIRDNHQWVPADVFPWDTSGKERIIEQKELPKMNPYIYKPIKR